MARIFITGCADGLGQLAAKELIRQGHQVVLHARNQQRAKEAIDHIPEAETVLAADLSDISQIKRLAGDVNALGNFDAIIHNAGVYQAAGSTIVNVNTLAPYILTSMIDLPKRLIYLSSGMHLSGDPKLNGLEADPPQATYSDSKLHDLILAKAVARKHPTVYANAIDPGWVPTKMGGKGAPDDLEQGFQTQVWLATSEDAAALVTGRYFHHKQEARYQLQSDETELQDRFLKICAKITGISFL